MDLRTTYMGMELKNPLVASASPLSREVDTVRKLEDAGIAAVVMYSLFEEEITAEAQAIDHYLSHGTESYAEALTYFPQRGAYTTGPDQYLQHLQDLKAAVDIPVIASLNGVALGGWVDYAARLQEAGADALELNVYFIPTDPHVSSPQVEQVYIDILQAVKATVSIPVAVKVGPYFSAFANMAQRLDEAGADALVLFNRFYQPDIDLEELAVVPNLLLSTPQAMRLPLRWIAILYGHVGCSMAATSGIATAEDVLKLTMAGADVTMLCAALLRHGPGIVPELLTGVSNFLEEHDYDSLSMARGSISQRSCAEPAAFERANYMKTLASYV